MKTLFFYEWKKIVNRKIVLICMLCAVLLIIFSIGIPLVGDYVVNGERLGSNYEEFQKDITYRKDLDGRAIDRTLLMEMQNAYPYSPSTSIGTVSAMRMFPDSARTITSIRFV